MFFYRDKADKIIDSFTGEYAFLSNFYDAPVIYNGLKYKNNEAAFQAQKLEHNMDRRQFTDLPPNEAKRLGRKVLLRDGWDNIRLTEMFGIVLAKFRQNPELAKKLVDTGDAYLEEGNWWNDKYWGVCNGEGRNMLGKILMVIRGEFQ